MGYWRYQLETTAGTNVGYYSALPESSSNVAVNQISGNVHLNASSGGLTSRTPGSWQQNRFDSMWPESPNTAADVL